MESKRISTAFNIYIISSFIYFIVCLQFLFPVFAYIFFLFFFQNDLRCGKLCPDDWKKIIEPVIYAALPFLTLGVIGFITMFSIYKRKQNAYKVMLIILSLQIIAAIYLNFQLLSLSEYGELLDRLNEGDTSIIKMVIVPAIFPTILLFFTVYLKKYFTK